ncbi:hypothetical protein B0H11DRAFT_2061639 [Mycena galericulata]|nr:hypothetical protein B0H11DRAFT_2061639 [Mycena galericulata]
MPSACTAHSVVPNADLEASLPPEIEREIFEWTAIHHPSSIPTLLRVARRVQLWVEPYLYRIMIPEPGRPYSIVEDAVLRPTSQSRPASFYRDAVRHLYLSYQFDASPEVLKVFTRTRYLAVTGSRVDSISPSELIPILLGMDLRRLSLSLEDLFGGREHIDLNHPLFNSITHLDVFDHVASIAPQISPHVTALPALTHLCLNNGVPGHILRALLSDCPRLRVLVNLWGIASPARYFARNPPVSDPRFVVGVYSDYKNEWIAGARGALDFWTIAEEFVRRKRSGGIPGLYLLTTIQFRRDLMCISWPILESSYWMGDESTEV